MTIADLKIGEQAKIKGFQKGNDPYYRQKLLALGLLPGASITLVRRAPLGDPVQIAFQNLSLILRKKEAEILLIEKI